MRRARTPPWAALAMGLLAFAGCTPRPASLGTVGGTVQGLTGDGLVLQVNGGGDLAVPAGASRFAFTALPIAEGQSYAVTVVHQPNGPSQRCTVQQGSGAMGAADVTTVSVTCVTGHLALEAGALSSEGNVDGAGADARFSSPNAVAVDRDGNVYVADQTNSVIRKITPAGVVSTWAGEAGTTGSADGQGAEARFNYPRGVASDGLNVYVADTSNHTLRMITRTGAVSTLAGKAGETGSADGVGSAARFNGPVALTLLKGDLFVADTGNHTVRRISLSGTAEVTTFAGTAGTVGSSDGVGGGAQFFGPASLAAAPSNEANHFLFRLYVADTANGTIRQIDEGRNVSTFAGTAGQMGNADGPAATATFTLPAGLAVAADGTLYVASGATLRKITPAGDVSTLAGVSGQMGAADGVGSAARFDAPGGLVVDTPLTGDLYVADPFGCNVRRVTPAGEVTTFAGTLYPIVQLDGPGLAARFFSPRGMVVDSSGDVYLADQTSVRKITPDGSVSTLFDGANTGFGLLTNVAVDGAGNVYAADTYRYAIHKITPAGEESTFAGVLGNQGYQDGTGVAVRLGLPTGMVFDPSGDLYVADGWTVRKITPAGEVSTFAGKGVRGSIDGPAGEARFGQLAGIARNPAGDLYLSDGENFTIRKITPGGEVSTFAGAAGESGSLDGVGAAARFVAPGPLAIDPAGNLYVVDGNATVRTISPEGEVTTLAGVPGQLGTVPGTLPASLLRPGGIAVDPASGKIYVSVPAAILSISYATP